MSSRPYRRSASGTSPRGRATFLHAVLRLLPGGLLLGSACSEGSPARGPDGSAQGATGGGTGTIPVLRGPVALEDDALANQALDLLGASAVNGSGVCKNCHTLGRPTLTRWAQLTQAFANECLGDADLDDQAALDQMFACFRQQADDGEPLAPEHFGIYAAASHLPWFSHVFERASGVGDRQKEKTSFITNVGMPRAGTPWTQAEFDIVAEWFARKTPKLFDLVPADEGAACTDGLDLGTLSEHVQEMATSGWRAKNAQLPLLDFGCENGQSGSACLGDFPLASSNGTTSDWQALGGAQIRVLYDNSNTPSTYWSRVSPDGRYIASGLLQPLAENRYGQIIDLAGGRVIPANFRYDATFFPDGSGFILQQNDGEASGEMITEPTDGSVSPREQALTCDYSVLSSGLTELTGSELECHQVLGRVGLYQQLASSVGGSDYWVVHGSYTSDNGGFEKVLNNPSAAYEATSKVTLTAVVHVGDGYDAGDSVQVALAHQGDPMLSPSGNLLATRIKGRELDLENSVIAAEHAGYALYKLTKANVRGTSSASVEDLGRLCVQGGKPTFSYDERWLVFHRYVTASDAQELGFASADEPGFQGYLANGSSNLYLVDLTTGNIARLTDMPPGKFALFPHFRSDGWIYFAVRTLAKQEFFAATDAALLRE
jgi:hypothetical protein